jgi:hypothetical protein
MAQTPEQYYGNEANFGSYQYVTLKEVIDEVMLESMDDDSFLKNTNRSKFILNAKQGIKKLTQDIPGEELVIVRTVGEQLSFPLPQNYVDYFYVSVIVDGKLMPININSNMNTGIGYLQDNDAELLFDEDGKILTSDGDNVFGKAYKKYAFCDNFRGGFSEMDTSRLSRYGEAVIDERRGMIAFSSDLMDKDVVLKYKSDGLQWEKLEESKITIHKMLQEPLRDWIYYSSITYKRNVPQSEKERALRRFKTTAHNATIKRSNIDILEISRIMNLKSKMI